MRLNGITFTTPSMLRIGDILDSPVIRVGDKVEIRRGRGLELRPGTA